MSFLTEFLSFLSLFLLVESVLLSLNVFGSLSLFDSWDPKGEMVWHRRRLQCPCDGITGP